MLKTTFHNAVQLTHNVAPFVLKALQRANLPDYIWHHLYFKGVISVDVFGSQFQMNHLGYQIENSLYWKGFGNGWEATSLRLWQKLAMNAETVIDIGANTGVYALSAKAVNPNARVYAIEPVARVHKRLEANIALNGWDISLIQAGISEVSGTATLYDVASEHEYSASLEKSMLAQRNDVVEYEVQTYSMVDFLNRHDESHISLIKIDVEKHEAAVLRGFGNLITEKLPTILIEILDRGVGEIIESLFPPNLFHFYEIIEGFGIKKVSELGGSGERNYLICPHSVAGANGFHDLVPHEKL